MWLKLRCSETVVEKWRVWKVMFKVNPRRSSRKTCFCSWLKRKGARKTLRNWKTQGDWRRMDGGVLGGRLECGDSEVRLFNPFRLVLKKHWSRWRIQNKGAKEDCVHVCTPMQGWPHREIYTPTHLRQLSKSGCIPGEHQEMKENRHGGKKSTKDESKVV